MHDAFDPFEFNGQNVGENEEKGRGSGGGDSSDTGEDNGLNTHHS